MRRKAHLSVAAALVLAACFGAATPEAGAIEMIQPGSSIVTGDAFCTLNWVYDGAGKQAGRLYVGTAAHCVEDAGAQADVWLATGTFGSPVIRIGKVAYVGDSKVDGRDYAFIEVDSANYSRVDASLTGHPSFPKGVSTAGTAQPGDLIQFSGHGTGFHASETTREERIGLLNFNDGRAHAVTGPVTPGDSGGPVADISDGDKALGIVTDVGGGLSPDALTVVEAGEFGLSLEGVLADAATNGFAVELHLANDPIAPPAEDGDGDGVPDGSDNCPAAANSGQADADADGQGDACDTPAGAPADTDGDGVPDGSDNCPAAANSGQADADADGQGDACESGDGDSSSGHPEPDAARPTATAEPTAPEQPAPAASCGSTALPVRVRLVTRSTRKVRRTRTLVIELRTMRPITSLTVRLTSPLSDRTLASGILAHLDSGATASLLVRRRLRAGSYLIVVKGKVDGRCLETSQRIRMRV